MKSFISKLLLLFVFSVSLAQCAIAHTDDSGVLGGLENNPDLYSYLNNYNYSLFLADHRYGHHDMYISADKSVIVSIWYLGCTNTARYFYHKTRLCHK